MTDLALRWDYGSATVLRTAAMLAECNFLLGGRSFSPFARAPWMGTLRDDSLIGHLRELGGDFVGVPFGGHALPADTPGEWAQLPSLPPTYPVHGPAGDSDWTVEEATNTAVKLSLDYFEPSPILRLERTIAARPDAPALDFTLIIHARRPAQISVGLHPIFRLPEQSGELELLADFAFGLVHPRQAVSEQAQEFSDLAAVPQGAGTVDLAHPPLNQANLNVQLCGMRSPITAIYKAENAGMVLDWDRTILPSLQIWHTDRGVDAHPWNGQYRGLGLEPIAAAFDLVDAISTGPNPINQRGVDTSIRIHPGSPVTVRHSISAFANEVP